MRLVLSLLLLPFGSAFAQVVTTNLDEMRAKGLPPHQLQVIKAIGNHILQAKQIDRTKNDQSDKDLLNQLQDTVAKLIASENLTKSTIPPISDSQDLTPNKQQAQNAAARKAAQSAAWDVVGKLNQESGQLQAAANGKATRVIMSGGLPIGEQRGRQYQQWVHQLESIINNSNDADRINRLLTLQSQIQPNQRGVIDAPTTAATPTLQALTRDAPPAIVERLATDSSKKHKVKN